MTEPEAGAAASVELVVKESDCASALRLTNDPLDQYPAVFATTRMIALMEYAGARILRPLIGAGEMSVGVAVDVVHSAPTPIGAKVTATARYRGQDGKLYVFDVVAHDPGGEIGRGTHKREIVSEELRQKRFSFPQSAICLLPAFVLSPAGVEPAGAVRHRRSPKGERAGCERINRTKARN